MARGGADSGSEILWLGSAGLAQRLADVLALPSESEVTRWPMVARPLLLVVGSPARATQAQLRRLRDSPGLVEVVLGEAESLEDGSGRVRRALQSGADSVLTLGERGRNGTMDGPARVGSPP